MTSQDPKILVAIPTYEGKDYMLHNCVNAVRRFNYKNFEYIIIDNSKSINYYLRLRRQGYKAENLARVPRGENSRQALCNAQNYARQKAIKENFDYILFVESDLLPKPDTINILLSHNKLIVGSVYFIGHEIKVPCIFERHFHVDQNSWGTRMVGTKINDDGSQSYDAEDIKKYINQGLKQVHGMGLGTTLIAREIFEKFPFWHDERFPDKHSDVWLYYDMDHANIPVFVDTNLYTEHRPSKWSDVKDR